MTEAKWVKIVMDETINPLALPYELNLILLGRIDLIGLYITMMFLSKSRTRYTTQPNTAKLAGLGYLAYLRKRKELEELGLLEVDGTRNNMAQINLLHPKLWGLIKMIRVSYQNDKSSLEDENIDKVKEYAVNTGKLLVEELKKTPLKEGQTELLHNIYIDNISNNKNNNNYKISNSNKDNSKKYPKEDYAMTINAFKKYKGVGLMGPEVAYHMRAIKMMFQAERKPKDIIDFMKWLHDNERNEETSWVKTWTIWTVQKKISEFVAGKLEVATGKEDLERI